MIGTQKDFVAALYSSVRMTLPRIWFRKGRVWGCAPIRLSLTTSGCGVAGHTEVGRCLRAKHKRSLRALSFGDLELVCNEAVLTRGREPGIPKGGEEKAR